MHCGWGKGGNTRKRNTDNQKPEVGTAATLVLVREVLEHELRSGTHIKYTYTCDVYSKALRIPLQLKALLNTPQEYKHSPHFIDTHFTYFHCTAQ